MRMLVALTLGFALAISAYPAEPEPEYGGVAQVQRELVFDVPLDRLVQVFREHRNDLMESRHNKVIKQEGDKVTIEITLPGGLITHITLQLRQGVDTDSGEAFFQSSIFQTDGFITKQDTLIWVKERGGKSVVDIGITVEAPEMRTAFIRGEIVGSINRIEKKIKAYLEPEK